MSVMRETESAQRQAGSDIDARSVEEVGHERVIGQRIPTPPHLAPPQSRPPGALACLLVRGNHDGAEVHAAMEGLNTTVGEYVRRELTLLVASIESSIRCSEREDRCPEREDRESDYSC